MEEVSTVPHQERVVFRRTRAEGCKQRTTTGLKQVCIHYGIFLLQSDVIQDEDYDWLNDFKLESVIVNKVTVCIVLHQRLFFLNVHATCNINAMYGEMIKMKAAMEHQARESKLLMKQLLSSMRQLQASMISSSPACFVSPVSS